MGIVEQEKENRKKMGINLLLKTIVYAFAVFGLIFILVLIGVLGIMSPSSKIAGVPEQAVLKIDFDANYAEIRSDDFFAEFTDKSAYSVFDLVRAINVAATDDRIKAISASVNITPLGLAQIQDISQSISDFRSKGKKAYIFSSGMGSFGQGSKEYYLATAFDEIWMQPNSDLGLTGINVEVPFFKNILQKIGIEPEFYTRYEYKTAVASLLDNDFSLAYKEEMSKLGSGLFKQLEFGILENRGLDFKEIEDLINKAPLSAEEAQEAKLIDKVGYRQQLEASLQSEYDSKFLNINDYMANISDYRGNDLPEIAVLVLEGVIEGGKSSNNPINEAIIGSESVIKQLEQLSEHKNLKALILRINSPGGSYTASDEILFALREFKAKKDIPIVVSMGNYAASGGYFIALAGDYIFAEPATITGSIGVLGGKIVLAELWKKLDINWGEISYGKNAGILSMNHKFSTSEKAVFNRSLDRIYTDFVSKVSQSRDLDLAKMDELARGRIWLGQDAVLNGLADECGGFELVLGKAKELGGILHKEEFGLTYYPRQQSFQEKLTKFLESGGGLPSVQILENLGLSLDDFKIISRMRHDAVLPPFNVKM